MLQSKLIGETYKEWPKEATLKSHGLLVKGGYIRQMATGIYTLLPLAKKVISKIETIIREEMNALGAQEILMPVVATKNLWDMSGRYDTIGNELLRFEDRTGAEMVLSMTHEEAVTFMAMTDAISYQKYPFSVYQLQTKFRDEARSRGGLIRVREFTMKDAYSFHTTKESLQEEYEKYYDAYLRIYKRVGIPEVVAVKSDTGMMGGEIAHEYQLLCDAGEDKIVLCDACNYCANIEVAGIQSLEAATTEVTSLEKIATPGVTTIEQLQTLLNLPASHMAKAVIYTRMDTLEPVIVFIRADREVNEAKIKKIIGVEELEPRNAKEGDAIVYGSVGPKDLQANTATVLYDISLQHEQNLVVGANIEGYHYTGFCMARDVGDVTYIDVCKITEQDGCPNCSQKAIHVAKGIEVGNIFQLDTKYTKSMNMTYSDENGKTQFPLMGCYGIGIGRLMASILEAKATQNATNWPVAIAPFDIHICPIDYQKVELVEMQANKMEKELIAKGYDVLLDDRNKSAGNKFADSDLIGAPIRIVLSPRNLPNELVEVKIKEGEPKLIPLDSIYEYIETERNRLLEEVKN